MKNLWGIAFGIVCGLLGAGLLLLITGRPRGEAIQLMPPPSPAPMVIHVAGAVNNPGVHTLPQGSRVKDAVEHAGGLAEGADSSLINLAMQVKDGMQIWVPFVQENPSSNNEPDKVNQIPVQNHPENLININTATQDELETLSGIGPVIASAIIQFRQEHGAFERISDIQAVSGIGPVVFEKIKPFITTGGASGD
ncbi:MAG: helix-hairpin-helix domain-containing protein [Anaerolineales bacterium]